MADTLTFTRNGTTTIVTPVPGSLKSGGGHDDRGGGTIPSVRAGFAMAGSCQVVVTAADTDNMQHSITTLLNLISQVGEGDVTVTGSGRYADIHSYLALLDVSISGDSVQLADISWKGTYNPGE